jgi:hypothetical protein
LSNAAKRTRGGICTPASQKWSVLTVFEPQSTLPCDVAHGNEVIDLIQGVRLATGFTRFAALIALDQ